VLAPPEELPAFALPAKLPPALAPPEPLLPVLAPPEGPPAPLVPPESVPGAFALPAELPWALAPPEEPPAEVPPTPPGISELAFWGSVEVLQAPTHVAAKNRNQGLCNEFMRAPRLAQPHASE
jgi:hypothetical protein